jgi:hypothetical protein
MVKKRPFLLLISLSIALLIITQLFSLSFRSVRGKALPHPAAPTPAQTTAQALALADARVQTYAGEHRIEVMGVQTVAANQVTAVSRTCLTATCYQVDIYDFDANATIQAIVNEERVLAVFYQPGVQPGINKRLADLALSIALNAPEVIEALGYQPQTADMAPVPADMPGTVCNGRHLCAGPTFNVGERALWAIVDLTDERLVDIAWTYLGPEGSATLFEPEGCPDSGSVNRDGWTLDHAIANSDGLHISDVRYNGQLVLTSAKLAEWHVDYGTTGFRDVIGCNVGGGGGGFPIYPYGDTQVLDLLDEQMQVVGFEVVQDFRMSQWGNNCNYRYEQHYQFWADGRFRIVSGAFGRGCGTISTYRPVIRIDIAAGGDDANDNAALWGGSDWLPQTIETYRVPYDEVGHGPHQLTAENYAWRVTDTSGAGFFIEPGIGQFDDGGRGDAPFVYFTLHKPEEGDSDLGLVGPCCNNDHQQGPDMFVDNEVITNTNIVLWYVPQMDTEVGGPKGHYCWTITGEPNPETYPCFSGPLFTPIPQEPQADFSYSRPSIISTTVAFANDSTGQAPLSYGWDFGDGMTDTITNPVHIYPGFGTYTATLTVDNVLGTDVVSATIMLAEPTHAYLPFIQNEGSLGH